MSAPFLHMPNCRLKARCHVNPIEQPAYVVLCRVNAQIKFTSDLLVVEALHYQEQHVALSTGQGWFHESPSALRAFK